MRSKGIDYFENSRREAYIQQQYAIDTPHNFTGYNKRCWGITASDGLGAEILKIEGIERQFYDYIGRGIPYGPDDGTIAPWAVLASLPFAPEIALPILDYYTCELKLREDTIYGFRSTFNRTYPKKTNPCACGWVSPWHYGLNQGPIILMIENYHTDLLWRLMRECPYIFHGLRRAGFNGGWL